MWTKSPSEQTAELEGEHPMDNKIMSLRLPHFVLAGPGASERIGQEAKGMGAKRALLVTDPGVMTSGMATKIRTLMEKEGIGVEIFDQVISDPDIRCCESASKGEEGQI